MTTKKNLSAGSLQRTSESLLKDIRRNTKRIFTSEQKVLIVMEGIRGGEQSIAELCRKYGISDITNEIRIFFIERESNICFWVIAVR